MSLDEALDAGQSGGVGGKSCDNGSKGSHKHRRRNSSLHFTPVNQTSTGATSHIDTSNKLGI